MITKRIVAVSSILLITILQSACGPDDPDPAKSNLTPEDRALVDRAFHSLYSGLKSTAQPLGSDATVLEEFRVNREAYESVVAFMRENPDVTRFNRRHDPARYYTFSARNGLVSDLDASISVILLSRAVPEIIDGDLRPGTREAHVKFWNYRSGTVVRGMGKGVAYLPESTPKVLTDSLDDVSAVRDTLHDTADRCAYLRIESDWYVWLCY